jgi:hypothetical protein
MEDYTDAQKPKVEPIPTTTRVLSIRRDGDWIIAQMSDGTTAFSLPRDKVQYVKTGPRNLAVEDHS